MSDTECPHGLGDPRGCAVCLGRPRDEQPGDGTDLPVVPCRSCGADIVWTTTVNGKRMPLDAMPNNYGKFVVYGTDAVVTRFVTLGRPRFESHFATCPHAAQHRSTR